MSLCASAGRAARTLPLAARPLTAEAFAPYGAVLATPETAGVRTYFDAALGTLAPQAPASLSIVRAAPVAARPVPVRSTTGASTMEPTARSPPRSMPTTS